jgi:transposase-like protein
MSALSSDAGPSPKSLRREVGIFGATMMGLGAIVGTGIFVSIGNAASVAGSWVVVAIAVAAVVACLNGLSSAQLAAAHPVSGGTYEYGYRWLHPSLGFTAGWMFLCAKSASAATAALGFAGYGLRLWGWDYPQLQVPIGLGAVVLVAGFVLVGIRWSSLFNSIVVSITLSALALFVVAEIHLGHRVVLLASDPIADNPIACALVSSNDGERMRRFLRNLKNHGFSPETVITDRSPLYPKTIAEVWPEAKHQLCVFHVISEVNDHVLDAVREVRRAIKPKRIKKGRGRPRRRQRARVKKLKEQRERADRLFRRRHLIVTKRSNIKSEDLSTLDALLSLSPTLRTLRAFVDDLHKLFALRRSKTQAWRI